MGFGRVLKRIGTMAAAPVVVPARKAKAGVETYAMNKILGSLIRAGLKALIPAGGAGLLVSDSEIDTIVSAVLIVGGIVNHFLHEKRTQGLAEGQSPTADK